MRLCQLPCICSAVQTSPVTAMLSCPCAKHRVCKALQPPSGTRQVFEHSVSPSHCSSSAGGHPSRQSCVENLISVAGLTVVALSLAMTCPWVSGGCRP